MPYKLFKRKVLQAVAVYSMVLASLVASVANLFTIASKSLVPEISDAFCANATQNVRTTEEQSIMYIVIGVKD